MSIGWFSKNFKQTLNRYRKYRMLVILAVLFLLLIIILATLSFITARELKGASQELLISSQQTVMVQQLHHNITAIQEYAELQKNKDTIKDVTPIANAIKYLKVYQSLLDDSIKTIKNGGTIIDIQGRTVVLDGISTSEMSEKIEKVLKEWQPYNQLVKDLLQESQQGSISKETLTKLVEYDKQHHDILQKYTVEFAVSLDNLMNRSTKMVQNAQIVGIILAFILFTFVVFGSLGQLLRSDEKLLLARKQTQGILGTVNEGLFLIDKNMVIGSEYSKNLETIIHQKNIAGKTLLDILQKTISQSDLETTKLFVEQLYNSWVVEDLVKDLNPLKQVRVSHADEKGRPLTQFLSFDFLRVKEADTEEINQVFVSVIDITESIKMQEALEREKQQHDRQIEMISAIMSIPAQALNAFIQETEQRIQQMNETLKTPPTNVSSLKTKVQSLFRQMHSLKGDASAIHLTTFVDVADKAEQQLQILQQQSWLDGKDFLQFTIFLNELLELNQFISNLIQRLRGDDLNTLVQQAIPKSLQSFEQQVDVPILEQTVSPVLGKWQTFFNNYAQDIAKRQGKKLVLDVQGFDELTLSESLLHSCKDVAMQLLKNAIVHGIESPAERLAQQKSDIGHVQLQLQQLPENKLRLMVQDDGRGLDVDKIRQKAIASGRISLAQTNTMSQKDWYKMVFDSGFSTAEDVNEDAGRGVGMDIVREISQNLHGKVGIASQPNEMTQISITFSAV